MPRFQADLSALTPGHQPQPLSVFGMSPDFPNGYIENYTAGIEQTFKDVVVNASYVGHRGREASRACSAPTAIAAPRPSSRASRSLIAAARWWAATVPSTSWERLPTPLTTPSRFPRPRTLPRLGLGFQSGYTFSKSLDDTSAIVLQLHRSHRHCPPDLASEPLESRRRQRALNL